MRIFLDANILFSASKSDGAVRGFLAALWDRGHTLVVDAYVMSEARRNLEAKLPGALADFESLWSGMESSAKVAPPLQEEIAPDLPWKDRPVLAAAIHLRCQVLLTGDKTHFGPLYEKTIEDVRILSPAGVAVYLQ